MMFAEDTETSEQKVTEKQRRETEEKEAMQQTLRMKREIREQQWKEQFDREKRSAERKVQEAHRKRDTRFQELYATLMKEREEFLVDIARNIENVELLEQQQKEKLYKRWCDQVFNPIQSRIQTMLDSQPSGELERKRRDMFEKFLHESNRKGGVFRDIIIEADYDPLESRNYHLRYTASDIDDPVKKSITKEQKERQLGLSTPSRKFSYGQKMPEHQSREVFDVKLWDKVESTPHGRYSKMFDSQHQQNSQTRKTFTSTITLDHYNVPNSYDAVRKELPKGIKIFPKKLKTTAQTIPADDT